jgi:hypothetical protein
MKVPDKATFMRLSQQGLLGNALQSWARPQDLNGYKGWVTIRCKIPDSPLFVPLTQHYNVESILEDYKKRGFESSNFYIQEVPIVPRIMNFEVMRDTKYLYLTYGTDPSLNLRHDLERNGRRLEGLEAALLLKNKLGREMDQLNDVWDEYPESIIEATMFSQPVGVFDRQLVLWEVRDY